MDYSDFLSALASYSALIFEAYSFSLFGISTLVQSERSSQRFSAEFLQKCLKCRETGVKILLQRLEYIKFYNNILQ